MIDEVRRGILLLALLAASAEARPPAPKLPKQSPVSAASVQGGAASRAAGIRSFANQWLGTSYLWGGVTRAGVDCSGYSRQMYRDVFRVELPRTTRQQILLGMDVPVTASKLGSGFEPGDLFFYVDPVGIPNHVVVYMGNGMFTHSASGRGVVVEGYKALWGRRIVGRRVLFPAQGGKPGEWAAIPPAPPIKAIEVPCPPEIRARGAEVRRFSAEVLELSKISGLIGDETRELCEWKALAIDLDRRGGETGKASAIVVREYIRWIESIDSFKDEQF